MKKEQYHYDKNRYTISDPDLGLEWDEEITIVQLPQQYEHGNMIAEDTFLYIEKDQGKKTEVSLSKHNLRIGEYAQFFPNGNLKSRQYYHKGLLHGPSTFFNENGQILAESWFINGLQEGRATLYYFDGSIYSLQRYRHNFWHGTQEFFYRDGTLKTLLSYQNGKLQGESVLYHPDGEIERAFQHANGVLTSADIRPPHAAKKR